MAAVKIPRNWKCLCMRWMLMLLCMAVLIPTVPSLAQTGIDPSAVGTLSVLYDPEKISSGVRFEVHRVADITADGDYLRSTDYSDYPVALHDLNSEGLRSRAATLEGYIVGKRMQPMREAYTDGSGQLLFENLPVGLYLLRGDAVKKDEQIYGIQSLLVSIPSLDKNGEYSYDVRVFPKLMLLSADETDVVIYKVWDDENNEAKKRPESITIKIYEGGELSETVELNDDNSWRYIWQPAHQDTNWTIVEEPVPDGYEVYVAQDDRVFVINNVLIAPEEEPEDQPEQPDSGGSSGGGKLPQTGLLWWPVPLLAGLGMAMFLIGWIQQKQEEKT